MEVFTLLKEVIDCRVVIELPPTYNHKKVRIIVAKDADDKTELSGLSSKERIELLQMFKGGDKFPDFEIDDYDVYKQ